MAATADDRGQPVAADRAVAARVYERWRRHDTRNRPRGPSSSSLRLILQVLQRGVDEERLAAAIDKAHRLPWYCGKNKTGQRFLSLRYLCRPGELDRIEQQEPPDDPADGF